MRPCSTLVAGALALAATATACATSGSPPSPHDGAASAPAVELVALLPMNEGYGPADHDAYEATIAPIGADHGMTRERAYTVTRFLGGAGPERASTIGFWTLAEPTTVQAVMGDGRYQENIPLRDRIHDMEHAAMYLAEPVFVGEEPARGRTLLVGLLVMKEGYGFADHAAYEDAIGAVTRRHGMRLYRSYRVLRPLGPGAPAAQVLAVWELPSPQALSAIMQDPDYQAEVPNRDRLHDMAATTMYFASPRRGGRR